MSAPSEYSFHNLTISFGTVLSLAQREIIYRCPKGIFYPFPDSEYIFWEYDEVVMVWGYLNVVDRLIISALFNFSPTYSLSDQAACGKCRYYITLNSPPFGKVIIEVVKVFSLVYSNLLAQVAFSSYPQQSCFLSYPQTTSWHFSLKIQKRNER